jgi:hypothetical protein
MSWPKHVPNGGPGRRRMSADRELRGFLARLLGRRAEHAVEQALVSIELATADGRALKRSSLAAGLVIATALRHVSPRPGPEAPDSSAREYALSLVSQPGHSKPAIRSARR